MSLHIELEDATLVFENLYTDMSASWFNAGWALIYDKFNLPRSQWINFSGGSIQGRFF